MARREVIEQVREATDVVDLIGSYFPLRRSGQSFKACCPFHEEKTPSFSVSPTRQTFHCFGCGEKGSAFDFVMKMERVEFGDALELLADRAGITIEAETGPMRQERSLRAELYRLHDWVHGFYRRALQSPEGETCLRYVRDRGISDEMVATFGIGYAPGGYTTLLGRAEEAGFAPGLLIKAGLALPGSKRPEPYDRFRDRLVFTIRDPMRRVIAFGARTLDGSEPKYLNSPETEIFSKSRTLYGLDRLRDHPRTEPVLVMEGYTDVVMSAQVGVAGAVATLGTALTSEHARILARYSERTVLVYDADQAGLAAAERGALQLLGAGHLDIKVATLPEGQDPCDFFRAQGATAREDLLGRTVDLLDFLLQRSAQRFDLATVDGRHRAAGELLRAAAAVQDPVVRDLILTRLAEHLRLSIHALREGADRVRRGEKPARRRNRSTVVEGGEDVPTLDSGHHDLLQAVLNDPKLLDQPPLADGVPEPIGDHRVRELISLFQESQARTTGPLLDLVEDSELRGMLRGLLLPEEDDRDLGRQLEGALTCLKNRVTLEEARHLTRKIEDGGDPNLLAAIQARFRTLKGGSSEGGSSEGEAVR